MTTSNDRGDSFGMADAFEIAALVYDEGVSVDHLTGYFASELAAAGRRIGGLIQLPPDEDDLPQRPQWLDVMSGEVLTGAMPQRPGRSAHMDADMLATATVRIRAAINARVDLLFISRFGEDERTVGGLSALFREAVKAGIPVLSSVQRPMTGAWLEFTGGIGTLLACRLKILRDWWQETDGRRSALLARKGLAAAAEAARLKRPVPVR